MMSWANSAGDFHNLFHHVMEELCLLGIGCLIVYLLALPTGDDKATRAKGAEVMGYGRAGHIHNGSNILHTLLAVAKDPEDSQPGRIS